MAEIGYIQVTRECNSKCIMCSNPPTGYHLEFQQAQNEVDALIQKGCCGVFLTGGEPTLYDQLPELIKYCLAKGIFPRIITNGQRIADIQYLKVLQAFGLQHLHLSVHSCHDEIQAKITRNKNALHNIKRALANLQELGGITTDINVTITKYNANHLSEIVTWVIDTYDFGNHFVFNNLDPYMNRVVENPDVVPRLNDFELELHQALCILRDYGKTFRVERVPLCYLTDFEHVSTETRKIIKKETRVTYFLDQRGVFSQKEWFYSKGQCCQVCALTSICSGLYALGKGFNESELYPVFIRPESVIEKVRHES